MYFILSECVTRVQFSSVQSLSCVWLFAAPWTTARQASLSITNSLSLLKLMSIESVIPSNHLILYHPRLLLPSIFPSIRVFFNVGSSHLVASLLELQPQHQSLQWVFRINFLSDFIWFYLLAVQGTQESSPTPQFKSINSSVLSFLYSPTLKSIHDHRKNHSFD